ncbi:MAG: mannitol dehydrogenase family protein, partial [Sphingomonas sp.]
IEDRFPTGRPDFASVGAQMVADVEPFERMKLRMLNGSHSTLAYLGYLAGHETVSAAMADAPFARLVHGLMTEEVMPTLEIPVAELSAYRDALIERFRNPALKHRTWQIAMDGSQKLPQRVLATLSDRLSHGLPIETHAMIVAAWMRYVTGIDEAGASIDVRDPLADVLATTAAETGPDRLASALLDMRQVFGELGRDERVRAAVTEALRRLYELGAARACR